MLAQIATTPGINLGAGIIEVMVFDKGAELGRPIVVRACDDLPGEVRMTCTSTGAEASIRAGEVCPGGLGKVNADPSADVWLKFSKREAPDEIRHERASINKGSRTGLSEYVPVCKPNGGISTTPEAVVKEVPFNGWTKYACGKDVTEFDAAEKTDVIFRGDLKSVSELIRKSSVSAAVLKDIRPHVDRAVKTCSIKWWWRWRDLLVCDGLSGLERSGSKSQQGRC